MKVAEHSTETIQHQILDQAFRRFGQFGFGKTTMAEIAKDCGMSSGNLYRYFTSKKEIGAACAKRCMSHAENILRETLRRPKLSVNQRLEALFVEKLKFLHGQFSDQPLLYDLVAYISEERGDLVCQHQEMEQSIIAEVLAEGNRMGEYDIPEIFETARTIHAAMTKFIAPHFMSRLFLKEAVPEVQRVVALLIRGLTKR